MLKRITKVTSLLVAAASIVSMVPAMAADVRKIDGQEGTVYDAKSNGDGTFFIDAELNDEAGAIYYYKDGEYNKLENADSGDAIGDVFAYDGENYLQMADGDYYVNLETGETTDEDIEGSIDDDADSALRSKIKDDNDGRFAESTYTGNILEPDTNVRNDGSGEATMWGISGKYRQYFYALENDKKFSSSDGYERSTSTIYSDPEGNYIDVDYNLGKVYVYSTTTDAGVTIENTEDTYEIEDGDTTYEIRAQIVNDITYDEGPEYILRTGKLSIFSKIKGEDDDTYVNITDEVEFGSKSNHYGQVYKQDDDGNDYVQVIQRISKAQASDDIDGIKYAKDVKTYFITDEEGNHQPLLGLKEDSDSSEDDIYKSIGLHALGGGTQGYNTSFLYDFINSKVYAETINFKSSNGYNYIDVDDYDDTDVESNGFKLGCGDVWALGDGYIKRFNAKDNAFEKLYKVDGSMTDLHCSLPIYAIAWNEDDEIYSIITPNASAEDTTASTDATDTTTTAGDTSKASGWVKNSDGTWSYVKTDGTKTTSWLNDGGVWYYLKADGVMATGWVNDNGTWYYLNTSGAMQTGWINDNGTWYYCNASGAMLANTTIDGYALGASGAWVK